MEQDNTQGEVNPAPQESAPETPAEQVQQQVSEQKKPERVFRKNGRNRSGTRSAAQKCAEVENESCGEIEDLANFKEKLSGSNISGYAEGQSSEKSEDKPFGKSRERRFDSDRPNRRGGDFKRREYTENTEASEEAKPAEVAEGEVENQENKETSPEGPFFESKKFTPRAVEVPLTDRRPKFTNDKSHEEGVVSYSSKGSECPSVSLFERIKNAIASIFGRKSDNGKKKFNKDRRHGDFKGHRHGGDRKFYNKDRRGGDFKRRHDSDRRPSQNRRPRDNNRNTPEA